MRCSGTAVYNCEMSPVCIALHTKSHLRTGKKRSASERLSPHVHLHQGPACCGGINTNTHARSCEEGAIRSGPLRRLGPRAPPCRQRPGRSWSPALRPASELRLLLLHAQKEGRMRAGPPEAALAPGFRLIETSLFELIMKVLRTRFGGRFLLAVALIRPGVRPGLASAQSSAPRAREAATPPRAAFELSSPPARALPNSAP